MSLCQDCLQPTDERTKVTLAVGNTVGNMWVCKVCLQKAPLAVTYAEGDIYDKQDIQPEQV